MFGNYQDFHDLIKQRRAPYQTACHVLAHLCSPNLGVDASLHLGRVK